MTLEGVEYFRYRVRFKLATGKRVRWMRWAPYPGALFDSLQRELEYRFTLKELPEGSDIRVEHAP